MEVKVIKGNIFNSKAQTLVNTVNCVGVMGKGIALVYKLRYPKMFDDYQEFCKKKQINIGKLWLYKGEQCAPWVLNFPTKKHWKYPSKMKYITQGLKKFCATYKEKKITSVAFPLLGVHNGGLDKNKVLEEMKKRLSTCEIDIEIYEYDPNAPDDLYKKFSSNWKKLNMEQIKSETSIRKDKINIITSAIESDEIKSMIGLIKKKGIGIKTMEQCFKFVMSNNALNPKNN